MEHYLYRILLANHLSADNVETPTVSSLFDNNEINDVMRSIFVMHTNTNIRHGPRMGEICGRLVGG